MIIMLKKIVHIFLGGQKSIVPKHKQELVCSALCMLLLFCLSGSAQGASYKNIGPTPSHLASSNSILVPIDRPTRLIISAIHLDVAVEMVGLKADGDLDT